MPSTDTLQVALFITCIMFLTVDADLLLRYGIEQSIKRKGNVRRLDSFSPIWLYRQLVIYLFLVGSITALYGPMSGLAMALTLASISIGIETRQTAFSLWNWLHFVRFGWIKQGFWVPYRSGAGLVESVSPFEIKLRLISDEVRSIPMTALKVNIPRAWEAARIKQHQISLVVDRQADLLAARAALMRTAASFAPDGIKGLCHVAYRDLSRKRTVVDVKLVTNTDDVHSIQKSLRQSLVSIGCQVFPTQTHSGLRLVTDKDDRAA